jgi:multiple sugar transport system ATP-binding protein
MQQLVLADVTKRYDDVVAAEDTNIEIEDGEFVSLVGPSGCGKSTTLEMIGGLTKPTEGSVYIAGEDVTDAAPKDRNVAMVFQNIALFPHMDVYDNISYGLRLQNRPKEEIDQRVDEAVEILQLEGMLQRMPAELSGGQRQRVAIGRAIVRDPAVFLMDEPLANLDAKLRVHMRTELQRIQRELDVTTVYVTHDQEEAMTMSDRIAVIDGGDLQQIAPPLTCYNEPANLFVAGFIGSPGMNFFEGRMTDYGFESEFFEVELDPASMGVSEGEDVTLGIRPEDVYLAEASSSLTHPTEAIEATTDVLEPMGKEILVYLLLAEDADIDLDDPSSGSQLLMSVDPSADIESDQTLEVVLDRRKISLFETDTSDAIQHGLVEPAQAGTDGAAGAEAETDD